MPTLPFFLCVMLSIDLALTLIGTFAIGAFGMTTLLTGVLVQGLLLAAIVRKQALHPIWLLVVGVAGGVLGVTRLVDTLAYRGDGASFLAVIRFFDIAMAATLLVAFLHKPTRFWLARAR
jgi:hypothetical protein